MVLCATSMTSSREQWYKSSRCSFWLTKRKIDKMPSIQCGLEILGAYWLNESAERQNKVLAYKNSLKLSLWSWILLTMWYTRVYCVIYISFTFMPRRFSKRPILSMPTRSITSITTGKGIYFYNIYNFVLIWTWLCFLSECFHRDVFVCISFWILLL